MLKEWYESHPGKNLNGIIYSAKSDPRLNPIQVAHMSKKINVHAPVQTYSETWVHKSNKYGTFISAEPVPDSSKRDDLPPVAEQWKQDYARRFVKGKENG